MSQFDKVVERRCTNSMKWDILKERFGKADILPMWVADMDFESPQPVIKAMLDRAQHGIYGYPVVSDALNQAFINWNAKRNQWSIHADSIVHSPGVVTSICCAVLSFTEKDDKIMVQTPVYYPFFSSVTENDRILVKNPLSSQNGYYTMDFDDLEKKMAQGVKMFILCSPNNPIGRVWKTEELSTLIDLCIKYQVMLVSDEIHSDLIFEGHVHQPIAKLCSNPDLKLITLLSPSKTFNLAGLSESIAVIENAALRNAFKKMLNATGAGMLNIFGLTAAQVAYEQGEPWLAELMAYLTDNLQLLTQYLNRHAPQIKVIQPESTYLAWLDCRQLPDKIGNLKEFFVHQAGVALNDGGIFGRDGDGFQRINFACPRKTLQIGLDAIVTAIQRL